MTGRRRTDGRRARRRLGVRLALILGCLGLALVGWRLADGLTVFGAGEQPPAPVPAERPADDAPPEATAQDGLPGPGLALGITEPNPALVWSPAARPTVPAPFQRWRRALGETRPAVYRLMVSWRQLQPRAGGPIDLDAPQSGCLRDRGPCAPWAGVREQLAALASRQREGGWEGLVVLLDTPEWAATAAHGCEPAGTEARARAPRRDSLPEYRAVVRAILDAAEAEGASLRYWSAWNEPNHPYFLARQRDSCGRSAGRIRSAPDYESLVRALDGVLAGAPGTRRVLGELAAISSSGGDGTDVASFVAALPRDLVCGAPVFAQHGYAGGRDPVPALARALAAHRCPTSPRIWITETGAGLPGVSLSAGARSASRPRACRELDARLRDWWEDPRVDVAVQYTMREDDLFRVGLVRTDLSAAWPTLAAWTAWSRRPAPSAPPPARECLDGR